MSNGARWVELGLSGKGWDGEHSNVAFVEISKIFVTQANVYC